MTEAQPQPDSRKTPPLARIVGKTAGRLWGLSLEEWWRRALRRAGAEFAAEKAGEAKASPERPVLMVRADIVLEEPLLAQLAAAREVVLAAAPPDLPPGMPRRAVAANVPARLAARAETLLAAETIDEDAARESALSVVGIDELAPGYNERLRKRARPYVLSLKHEPKRAVERRMFHASYKGITDFVTKYLWPLPARVVTRWAAERGLTPNAVTSVSLALVVIATLFFAEGAFAAGLVAAWTMTFLDTVDGKLARVTLTSSRWGTVYDHGIDILHPPFWYAAWWYGLAASGAEISWLAPEPLLVIGGYVLSRVLEGVFLALFRIETHMWRRLDSFFRLVAARRNPNLVLLTAAAVLGRPDLGFLSVAIWTALTVLFQMVRLGQAVMIRRRGGPISSWLTDG